MGVIKKGMIKWTHGKTTVLYQVAEATEPLTFVVTENDISKAAKLKGYADPNCCVAACAVKRQFVDAIFQRDTAYTLQVHGGKILAVRYRLGGSLRRAIAHFDSGGIFPAGSYKLLAPTASQTLSAKRERFRKKPVTKRKVRKHTKFSARGVVPPSS